jgi:hypothetical protein
VRNRQVGHVVLGPGAARFADGAAGVERHQPGTVFAQRGNLLRPALLAHAARPAALQPLTTRIARRPAPKPSCCSRWRVPGRAPLLGEFRDWYFLPMIGCIWSCPTDADAAVPGRHHDPLLPQPRPAAGGRPAAVVDGARRRAPLRREDRRGHRRQAPAHAGARISAAPAPRARGHTERGWESFDKVVLATHSDQALAAARRRRRPSAQVLGAIRYQPNRAVLHTDASVLPQRRAAWAAWNYEARRRRARIRRASACTTC